MAVLIGNEHTYPSPASPVYRPSLYTWNTLLYIHTCSRNDCIPLVYSVPCNMARSREVISEVVGVHCTEMEITKNKNP
jgi:hypothetical protein